MPLCQKEHKYDIAISRLLSGKVCGLTSYQNVPVNFLSFSVDVQFCAMLI